VKQKKKKQTPVKEIKDAKKNQMENLELKNVITNLKILVEGLNSRIEMTEEKTSLN
jgi:hypothetical protein